MKTSDIMLMCFQNLSRSKGRTLLTTIGVVVGTCAIVVMISIGIGQKASVDAMLAQMRDLTVIEVYSYGGKNPTTGETLILDDKALAGIKGQPHVVMATPFYQPSINMRFVAGRGDRYEMPWATVIGVDPDALEFLGFELLEGNYDFTTTRRGAVAVVTGQNTSYGFRDTKRKGSGRYRDPYPDAQGNIIDPFVDLMTETATLQILSHEAGKDPLKYELVVNGRLREDYSKGWETYDSIFMDIATAKELEAAYNKLNKIKADPDQQSGYNNAKVKVSDIKYVEEVETYIQSLGYDTYSMESIRKPLQEQALQQQIFLGCIGAIALVVAAIGIANTMFMSILERTREIGIMKVVGCFVGDIRTAFLLEASSIGFIGGCIGIILSFAISWLMNTFGFSLGGMGGGMGYGDAQMGTQVSIIPSWLVLAALIFSTVIGLVSGYFPSNRAVKIEALEAIKHE